MENTYTHFKYKPIDYSQYFDINDLPERDDEELANAPLHTMPEFMKVIIYAICVNDDGKIDFMRKFGIRYLSDPDFRLITEDCVFPFVGGNYCGAYESDSKALTIAQELNIKNNEKRSIILFAVNNNIIDEYTN